MDYNGDWHQLSEEHGSHIWSCTSEKDFHFSYAAFLANEGDQDAILREIPENVETQLSVCHLFLVRTLLDEPAKIVIQGKEKGRKVQFKGPPEDPELFVSGGHVYHESNGGDQSSASICTCRVGIMRDSFLEADEVTIAGSLRLRLAEGSGSMKSFRTVDAGTYSFQVRKQIQRPSQV